MEHKYRKFKILSLFLVMILLFQSFMSKGSLFVSYAQNGTVITDCLNLRTGPGTGYSSAGTLSTNARVEILSSVRGEDGKIWYQVSSSLGKGFLRSDYVNLDVIYNAADSDFETYMKQQGFPESYKNALRGLHQKYPNWVFIAQHTGLDWNTVIEEESKIGRNLVYTDSISSYKSTEEGAFDWGANYWPGFDGAVWVAASREIIEHYMDPRNFLTDPYVFQFQVQSYDSAIQTREGLLKMVQGTFLEGEPGQTANGNASGVNGPSSSGSGPSGTSSNTGSSQNGISFIGPVAETEVPFAERLFLFLGGITAEANWEKKENGWYYLNEDGSMNVSGWFWLDGNKDGISECYYFYDNGLMAADTAIGDLTVNKDGQWVRDGVIQTKKNNSAGSIASVSSQSYVDLIMEAAKQSGVSPYVLAAMIIQEQGKQGTSPMISGTNSSHYGYYNFYNIAAYEHDGMSAVEAGLKYASESGNGSRPWNTVEKGIIGGAVAYGANYTDQGQDTFYLKKFNVQGENMYNHQYMTNVVAAAQEGAKISDAYSTEIKNSALTFKIPVYTGMPDNACEIPVKTGSPNNKLNSLQIDGYSLTPTFHMDTADYSMIVDGSVSSVNISATPIDSHSTVTGNGTRQLGEGLNEIIISVTAENGDVRNYKISITKKGVMNETGSASTSSSGPAAVSQNTPVTSGPSPAAAADNGQSSEGKESVVEFCGPPM